MGGIVVGIFMLVIGVGMVTDGLTGLGAVLAMIGAIMAISAYGNARAWKNRPMRLCTNCYVTAQPLRYKNKRWYCGRCGADNPAPLDSPLAQAFYAKQQTKTTPELRS